MHDSGPPAVRIDVPQCAMTQLPPFAPAANLSTPLSLGLRATLAANGFGRSAERSGAIALDAQIHLDRAGS